MRARFLALALATSALTACATAARGPAPAAAVAAGGAAGSAYGLFLSGQVAMSNGDVGRAADSFARAGAVDPMSTSIRDRAFMTALLSGDVSRAALIGPAASDAPSTSALPTAPEAPADTPEGRRAQMAALRTAREAVRSNGAVQTARLARAVDSLAAGRGREARDQLAADLGQHESAAILLRPWAAAAAGDWASAFSEVAAQGEAGGLRDANAITRATLLERRGDRPGAEAAYAALAATSTDSLAVLARGGYLERTGRTTEALALYDRALAVGEQALVGAARARAASGDRPPSVPTVQEGAARALLTPALAYTSARQHEAALMYLRLALRLDPRMDEGWLMAGDALAALDDEPAARQAYAEVALGSPLFGLAHGKRIASLQRQGQDAEALRLAQEAANRAPRDEGLRLVLAGVLMDQRRYPDAVTALSNAGATSWRVAYARGIALERAGRWPEAEAALQTAIRLHPDDPELLNYLGYAWADRGVHMAEATAMLDRAMQMRPESGAIVDSVGWARYRAGRYEEALRLLERAAQLSPGDADVNNHLGDVYWRVGRRTEAEFQWRRVLSLEPTPEIRAAAEAKLASGRGPTDTPVNPPPAAPASATRA